MTSVEHTKSDGVIVGYARTSSSDQIAGLEHQIRELESAGCTRVFAEHVSAIDRHRPELEAALDWLRSGDTFVVTKPDRLARSVTDLLAIVERLRSKGVAVRVLSMNLDSASAASVLTLSIMGAVSQWERDSMLERQRAGVARAQALGKYRGRAPTARAKAPQVLKLKAEGKPVAEIVQAVGISRASVYRALAQEALRSGQPRQA